MSNRQHTRRRQIRHTERLRQIEALQLEMEQHFRRYAWWSPWLYLIAGIFGSIGCGLAVHTHSLIWWDVGLVIAVLIIGLFCVARGRASQRLLDQLESLYEARNEEEEDSDD